MKMVYMNYHLNSLNYKQAQKSNSWDENSNILPNKMNEQ